MIDKVAAATGLCAGSRRGRFGDLALSQRQFRQPCPGALQRTLDRRRRGFEHDRDLVGGERQHVAQHQHRPLSRRKVLQARDERQPKSLTRRDDDRGIGRVGNHHRVRRRLQPRGSGSGIAQRRIGIRFRVEGARGQRSPTASSQLGEAPVRGDLVEPGAH